LLNPFIQQNSQTRSITNGTQSSSPVTVSDALILAGGITPNADLRNILIRRVIPSDQVSAPQGSNKTIGLMARNSPINPTELTRAEIKVDLWKAIQSGDLTADSRIYDGDEIVVLPTQLSNADQQALLTSTLAPNKITVQVTGEVTRPGQVDVSPNAKVFDTIAAAGGTTDKADKRSVELFRMSPQGQLERQTFDLNKPSITVRNGDLLVVRKSGSSKFLDVLGQVFLPLYPVTTILNLFR
jgi:polysaccharide export outer membrane protein